jgi:hypothetical protein
MMKANMIGLVIAPPSGGQPPEGAFKKMSRAAMLPGDERSDAPYSFLAQ